MRPTTHHASPGTTGALVASLACRSSASAVRLARAARSAAFLAASDLSPALRATLAASRASTFARAEPSIAMRALVALRCASAPATPALKCCLSTLASIDLGGFADESFMEGPRGCGWEPVGVALDHVFAL